jgi:hypothetical protein
MTKTGKVTIAVLIGGLAAGLAGGVSCGGVSGSDVVNARNQATTASCNYFMMCGQIGPGQQNNGGYDTYQDCLTQVMGSWTNGWPTSTCEGHIDQRQLTVCLDAIGSTTDCNGLAVLITLTKCGSGTVCSANLTDAGGGN